ncbi:MAG: hypothetical protein U0183_11780 [Polyangiaceae bacterium]
MKAIRRSLLPLFALSTAIVSGFALPACGSDATTEDEDTSTEDITVAGVPEDTFLTTVLGNAKCTIIVKGKRVANRKGKEACPTTLAALLDRLEGVAPAAPAPSASGSAPAPAPSAGTTVKPEFFVVSENGDKPSLDNTYRFVIAGGAGVPTDKLYVASFASGKGAPQGGTEVMAWSEKIQAFVYYRESGGAWERMGDGTMVPSSAKGAQPTFQCMNCHTSGAPIMKELHDSWANWTSTWMTVVDPKSPDATFNRMFSKVVRADDMEKRIISSTHMHSKGRVERAKAGGDLKGVLTQLFCDVGEGTLIAAHSKNSQRFGTVSTFSSMLPGAFVVSPLLRAPRTGTGVELGLEQSVGLKLPTVDSLSVDSKAYSDTLTKFASKIGGQAGDSIFPMNGPEKSYADVDAVQELVRQGLVDADFVADVLMTDFTTPAFSSARCGLAEALPKTWKDPADLKAQFGANLAKSTARGAKGLAARIAKTDDAAAHTATLEAYGKACSDRKTASAAAFTEDTLRILSQRRAEFIDVYHNLVESDSLLPSDNLGSKPGAQRFNGTTCVLEPATAKFVGEE